MPASQWFSVGRIIKTHGIHGEVVLKADKELTEVILHKESVFIELNNELVPFLLTDAFRMQADSLVIAFEDIANPEQAKFILQKNVFIPTSELPSRKENTLQAFHVNGYNVIDIEFGHIGTATEILHTPMQSLLVVDSPGGEVLIPVDESIILEVNDADKVIRVDLPDGLLELND